MKSNKYQIIRRASQYIAWEKNILFPDLLMLAVNATNVQLQAVCKDEQVQDVAGWRIDCICSYIFVNRLAIAVQIY